MLTFICHSDDDGQTWSKPVDISRQVKHPKLLNANTPGAMIQLTKGPHKGRVVTGLWGTLPIMKDGKRSREWQIVVAYSDDNGQSWKRTEPLEDKSGIGFPNECQVAEAANGDIVLISRNQGGERFRKKAISHDGGETWTPLDIDRGLPSVACMGSVIKGPVKRRWHVGFVGVVPVQRRPQRRTDRGLERQRQDMANRESHSRPIRLLGAAGLAGPEEPAVPVRKRRLQVGNTDNDPIR